MSDIKPQGTRVTISTTSEGNCGGEGCPQFAKSTFEQYQPSECKVTGLKAILWLPCPVAARRMAQWAERARFLLSELAQIDVPIESARFMEAAKLLRDYPGRQGGE